MDKYVLEKNILDLRHQFQIEKLKVSLTLLTIGLLGFIGTFIWYTNRIMFGITLSLVIILIAIFIYTSAKNEINKILRSIGSLSAKQFELQKH